MFPLDWILAWLRAFALTVIVEVPIAMLLLRTAEPNIFRRGAIAFFAQLVTHPCVWFVFAWLPFSWPVDITIAEAWAWGVEIVFYAVVIKELSWKRAALTSIAANATSFGLGLILEPWL
jgi:hypothetical protein